MWKIGKAWSIRWCNRTQLSYRPKLTRPSWFFFCMKRWKVWKGLGTRLCEEYVYIVSYVNRKLEWLTVYGSLWQVLKPCTLYYAAYSLLCLWLHSCPMLKDRIFNNLYRGSAPVDRVKYGVLNIGKRLTTNVSCDSLVSIKISLFSWWSSWC